MRADVVDRGERLIVGPDDAHHRQLGIQRPRFTLDAVMRQSLGLAHRERRACILQAARRLAHGRRQ